MLKLLLIVLCIILCLLSCSRQTEESAETAVPPIAVGGTIARDTPAPVQIEWSDFVKYNGQIYEGDWNETEVPLENVGKLLGYTDNDVPSYIENFEEYILPDNASPFRIFGSPFYTVLDNENAIAVYDENNETYYLYQLDE